MDDTILQATKTDTSQVFTGLSLRERIQLREWQSAARVIGIDSVEDLANRPWPCPIEGVVIGVYHAGDTAASWMVIGNRGNWAVASCADGTVSTTFHSLTDALALIFSADEE